MEKIINDTYSIYTKEDELCQTNGYFSLNMRKSSVSVIIELLDLKNCTKKDSVGWIGCGDGREMFCAAQSFPDISFTGIDINVHAIDVAIRKQQMLNIRNVTLKHEDILNSETKYSHVFSSAIAGPKFYLHLHKICTKRLCMLKQFLS